MNTPPQIIPSQLENDVPELDEDLEPLEETPKPGLAGRAIGFLKSPIGIGAVAVLIIALGAAAMLTSIAFTKSAEPQSEENGALAGDDGIVSEELVAQSKPEDKEVDGEIIAEEEEEVDKFSSEYGSVTFSNNGAVYHTVPTTIALSVSGQNRKLTLSVGILTDAQSADLLLLEGLEVNLLKIEVAEELQLGPYLDWQIPGLVSKNLKQRLEVAYPDLKVRGIMIRDFSLV